MAHDSDSSAASAALRGASLAFSHQKQQQQQQLATPTQHRAPSVSPSRPPHSSSSYNSASSIPLSSLHRHDTGHSTVSSNNALLAANAASLTGSTRPVPTINTPHQQLLRPMSPVRSPSPSRDAAVAARASQSRSPSRLPPAGSGPGLAAPVSARSASFLAATRAASRTASQAASPGMTPSHTGHGSGGTLGGGGGPPSAHLSAALSASAAGDERRRAAAAAVAANSAATSWSTDSLGRFSAAYTANSHSASSLAPTTASDPDTSAIPPTSSLISMFEESTTKPAPDPKPKPKKPKTPKTPKTPTTLLVQTHTSTPIDADEPLTVAKPLKAFTPPRSVSPRKDDAGDGDDRERTPKVRTAAKAKPKPPPSPKAEQKAPPKPAQSEPRQAAKPVPTPKPKPKPKLPADTTTTTDRPFKADKIGPAKPQKLERSSTGNTLRQHRLSLRDLNDEADVMDRPSLAPMQAPTPPRPRTRDPNVASGKSAVSAVSAASRAHSTATSSSPVGRAASTASHLPQNRRASVSGVPTPPPPRRSATAIDGLASAIMAGSLATAAAAKLTPQPTSSSAAARPPSPPKRTTTMLHTLRRDRSPHAEDDDEIYESHYKRSHYHRDGRLRQGKLHFSHATGTAARNKHQHHHEGARKRWREAITERQRRRYEAVWASNRGQCGLQASVDYGLDDEMVPNVVVRDIWRRSRLPADELAEVWNLVDETGSGGLTKTGFVVGMWLIDQRLRGRKIPARVSDSVWSSARGMQPKRR